MTERQKLFQVWDGKALTFWDSKKEAKKFRDAMQAVGVKFCVVSRGPDHWRGQTLNARWAGLDADATE
jgi:hypothetical protein